MAKGRRDFGNIREHRAKLNYYSRQALLAVELGQAESSEFFAKQAAHYGGLILFIQGVK